jgi:hypothetical protein
MSDIDHTFTPTIPLNAFYYGDSYKNPNNFFCVPYAFDIYIETFFSNIFYAGDMTRLLYTPDSMMFRERDRKSEGVLNLPYFTYYLNSIDSGTSNRKMFSQQANIQGIDLGLTNETGVKIRTVPATLNYTINFLTDQPKDKLFIETLLLQIDSNETEFFADLVVEESTKVIRNPGFVYFDIDTSPEFDEQEWLEKNKILIISADMQIETNLLFSNSHNFAITEETIFNFLVSKDLTDFDSFPNSEGILLTFEEYLNPPT